MKAIWEWLFLMDIGAFFLFACLPARADDFVPSPKFTVNSDGSITVLISPADAKMCAENGGCGMASATWMQDTITALTMKHLHEAVDAQCGHRISYDNAL